MQNYYFQNHNGTIVCDEQWSSSYMMFCSYIGMTIFMIWIPLAVLISTQIIMYKRLQRQARKHTASTNQSRIQRMSQVCKTFRVVVIVFGFCTVPFAVYFHILTYMNAFHSNYFQKNIKTLLTFYEIFFIVMGTNSIWNPLIYGKIHQNVRKGFRTLSERGLSSLTQRRPREASNVSRITIISNRSLRQDIELSQM